jgi:ornithine carbamoyltransferase
MSHAMKDLLRTANLTQDDLSLLLDLATQYQEDPLRHRETLAGETVVLFFDKPSTRTRISLETAVVRLGGLPVAVGRDEMQLGRGETIEDTAQVISSYARAFAIRTFSDEDVQRFASAAAIPVINALTDTHHPCQSLADLLTLREHFGTLHGLRLAYVGDGNNNVAHSLMEGAMLMGLDMTLATPPTYEPHPDVVAWARAQAEVTGGRLRILRDPAEAVQGARAVYTDLWVSLGNADHERAARRIAFRPYRVDQALMALADREAVFMHCLPANRNEEVAADVIDGPQSVVFRQAANRLCTGQAVLYALLKGLLRGWES